MNCPHCKYFLLIPKKLYQGRAEVANLFCQSCFRAFWGDGVIAPEKEVWQLREVGVLVDVVLTGDPDKMAYRIKLV